MSTNTISKPKNLAFPGSVTYLAYPLSNSFDISEPTVPAGIAGLGLWTKRILDILGSVCLILLLLPLMLSISIGILLSSPGPITYKSLRTGKAGKKFYMYKFRTMHEDADGALEQLRQKANRNGQLFKMANDPRVTRFGSFLRKSSLDELPQLFNVLKGEMSLVGPRPFIQQESEMFQPPYTCRFNVLPGMTGPWQTSGRSNTTFQQLCELDMHYVQNWSLFLDFHILLMTFPAVLQSRGAY